MNLVEALVLLLFINISLSYSHLKNKQNGATYWRRNRETFTKPKQSIEIKQKMRYFKHNENALKPVEHKGTRPSRRYILSDSRENSSSSTSTEEEYWKRHWTEYWNKKKFEAINGTENIGDTVDMVAARPWGVPCGDPNQHDTPWGSCTLAAECEGEYRIYRGDIFCGRTMYVCCAILATNYDMYQGIDQSFDESSFSTDTEERRKRKRTSKERKRRKRRQQKKRRLKDRIKRKRKIKRNIKIIVSEIKKIMGRLFRNRTQQRRKKTRWLKRYIKQLKAQLKRDRQSIKAIHSKEIMKHDTNILQTLKQIREVNQKFIGNASIRDLVRNLSKPSGALVFTDVSDEDPFANKWLDGPDGRRFRPKDNLDIELRYDLESDDDLQF